MCRWREPGSAPPAAMPCSSTQSNTTLAARARRLTGYWADCEAGVGGNLAAARAVWEAALKGAAGQYAEAWAAYIDFERRRGHTREARTLYKRCYT